MERIAAQLLPGVRLVRNFLVEHDIESEIPELALSWTELDEMVRQLAAAVAVRTPSRG
jgi:hypothetical protein